MSIWLLTYQQVYLSAILMTNISQSFTYKMAAKLNWHRYGTKLNHCYHTYTNRKPLVARSSRASEERIMRSVVSVRPFPPCIFWTRLNKSPLNLILHVYGSWPQLARDWKSDFIGQGQRSMINVFACYADIYYGILIEIREIQAY